MSTITYIFPNRGKFIIDLEKIYNKEEEVIKSLLDSEYYELNENYRNTLQVVDYCNKVLNLKMKDLGVNGNEVIVKKFQDVEEVVECAKNNSATVVTNNQEVLNKLKVKDGVRAMSVKASKGLEFKNVIVIDDNLSKNEKYVAYTRSLNDLIIYLM